MSCVVVNLRLFLANFKTRKGPDYFSSYILIRITLQSKEVALSVFLGVYI